MGVYVPNMEVPKGCMLCPFVTEFAQCTLTNKRWINMSMAFENRLDDCPLVEVKPHGRLIDADALMKQIEHDTPLSAVFEKTMRRYLHNAPTIIESEGDE